MNPTRPLAALAVITALVAPAGAQAPPGAARPYSPLFPEALLNQASPEDREKMRDAEAQHRREWEARQRMRAAAAARAAEEDARDVEPVVVPGVTTEAQPPAPRGEPMQRGQARPPRGKIYRWVDKDGQVHYGDAPRGVEAEVVTVPDAPAGGASGAAPAARGASPPPTRRRPGS